MVFEKVPTPIRVALGDDDVIDLESGKPLAITDWEILGIAEVHSVAGSHDEWPDIPRIEATPPTSAQEQIEPFACGGVDREIDRHRPLAVGVPDKMSAVEFDQGHCPAKITRCCF